MRAVLLNSGGKDSLASAILLAPQYELHSLYVAMGQPEERLALPVAEKVAAKYCASHHTMRIVTGPYRATTPHLAEPKTFTDIPFKNAVLWSLGAMYAATIGAEAVALGTRPDVVTPDFTARIQLLYSMTLTLRPAPLVLTPVAHTQAGDVFDIIKDEPLWRDTVYCVEDPPCRKCFGCRLRLKWDQAACSGSE